MNIIDLIMGRPAVTPINDALEQASRELDEYRSHREEHERQQQDIARLSTRADLAEMRRVVVEPQTCAVSGWWKSCGTPYALARSLHKLKDAIDMQRLTPDLDW